jgi:hypothetical protein|tara:strand:+ start:2074 stop:2970 length:897 start_codon:yes stop_codon:yes gene_type:complete
MVANNATGTQDVGINEDIIINNDNGQIGLRIRRNSSDHVVGSYNINQTKPFLQFEFGGTGSALPVTGEDALFSITYDSSSAPGSINLNTGADHYTSSNNNATYTNFQGANLTLAANSGINVSLGTLIPYTAGGYDLGISNHRWANLYLTGSVYSPSDERLKIGITTSSLGLNFINRLRPVSYKFQLAEHVISRDENGAILRKDNSREMVTTPRQGVRDHYGLIAQEVKQALDEVGVGSSTFAGWSLEDKDDSDSTQSLSYIEFISPIIKSIQEQQELINQLQTQNANLTARIEALESG